MEERKQAITKCGGRDNAITSRNNEGKLSRLDRRMRGREREREINIHKIPKRGKHRWMIQKTLKGTTDTRDRESG